MTIPLLAVLLIAVSPAPGAAADPSLTPDLRSALQARLDGIRDKYSIPGISVAIQLPDGSTWLGTSGDADLANATAVTPDTAFGIASVSKTFTAALILDLVSDGRLGLDDPVDRHLPGLGLDPEITVRQLLDHTSGLQDYFLTRRIDAALQGDPSRRWDAQDALAFVGKPYFEPGTSWRYSNTNYLVLGMLAEEIGGAPLADLLRDRFFEPLGMGHTWYQPTEAPQASLARAYRLTGSGTETRAIDLSDGGGIMPFTSVVTAAAGAGGIASTAGDLVRWARALYEGGALDRASVAEMVGDVDRTEPFDPRLPYGLGVQAVPIAGHRALGHSGRLLGTRSVVRWLPDERIAIAVLTNQSRTDPGIIARALLRVVDRAGASCDCDDVR
jgi:D-alanyl-D-alanine carboxypeptidase